MLKISYQNTMQSRIYIINYVEQQKLINTNYRVVDLGGQAYSWTDNIRDLLIDKFADNSDNSLNMNMCIESDWNKLFDIVNKQGMFDYAICTHTLEDLYNPFTALNFLPKVAKAGVISMPCLRTELSPVENIADQWLGYCHHRWLFDQDSNGQRMLLAPKLTFIEKLCRGLIKPNERSESIVYEWEDSIEYWDLTDSKFDDTMDFINRGYGGMIANYRDHLGSLVTSNRKQL